MVHLLAAAMLFLQPGLERHTANDYAAAFKAASEETGECPYLLAAVGFYESTWNTELISYAGACGVMQIMSHKLKSWRRRQPTCKALRRDPIENIHAGARELASNRGVAGSDDHLALCMYHMGPNGGCKAGRTTGYSRGVLWVRDLLVRHASRSPVGDMCCSVTVPVVDSLATAEDCVPVYSVEMPKAGRRFVRLRRKRVEGALKRMVLAAACTDFETLDDCMYRRGKKYECDFESTLLPESELDYDGDEGADDAPGDGAYNDGSPDHALEAGPVCLQLLHAFRRVVLISFEGIETAVGGAVNLDAEFRSRYWFHGATSVTPYLYSDNGVRVNRPPQMKERCHAHG